MKHITPFLSHKFTLFFFVFCSALSLAACGRVSQASEETNSNSLAEISFSDPTGAQGAKRPFFNAQTTIFHSLNVSEGEPVSVDLDVYLYETNAEFLFIEAAQDCAVKISYTYSTEDSEGVILGCCAESGGEKYSSELTAATAEAYDIFWTDETVSLKKGMNVFFLSGNDKNCKMHLELSTEDHENFSYVSAFPRTMTDRFEHAEE